MCGLLTQHPRGVGRRHQRALIDSGASCFVVPDNTLLDEASADVFFDSDATLDLAPLETAGSEVPVSKESVLFAKIHDAKTHDSSDSETTTIIRVRAFVAPELQTDILLPVTGLADEVTFRAPHADGAGPTARLRVKDVNGDEHHLSSTSEGRVLSVSLEPLTKQPLDLTLIRRIGRSLALAKRTSQAECAGGMRVLGRSRDEHG